MRGALSDVWCPLVGLGLCMMVVGFSLGSQYALSPITAAQPSILGEALGGVAASALVVFLSTRLSEKISINTMLQVLLPAVASVLLLTWMVRPSNAQFSEQVLMGIGFGICSTVFVVGTWVYLASTVHEAHVAPNLMAGISGALLFGAVACSAVLILFVGAAASEIITPIATVIYLALIGAIMVLRNAQNQPVAFSREIDDVCSEVAHERKLSPREEEVLVYLARGRTNRYIANELCVSPHTAKTHTKRIYEKLGVNSRQEVIDMIEAHR